MCNGERDFCAVTAQTASWVRLPSNFAPIAGAGLLLWLVLLLSADSGDGWAAIVQQPQRRAQRELAASRHLAAAGLPLRRSAAPAS
jgi:hypothetical protein